MVAIPTTSGTGSEVTPFATVWDHEQHKKYSLAGEWVYPDVALLDASLTLTLSEEDTLYPALDAISHALESLWNKNCTPVSRAFAFQALVLSNKALPLVIKEPNNLNARRDLQNASVLSGLAISQTRTAIAHSISYPITSRLGVPHGLACSFILPKLLEININNLDCNASERTILETNLIMLRSLELPKRLSIYANKEQVRMLGLEMINPDRMSNYNGELIDTDIAWKVLDFEK
jgi:alcohol dehydrogenase